MNAATSCTHVCTHPQADKNINTHQHSCTRNNTLTQQYFQIPTRSHMAYCHIHPELKNCRTCRCIWYGGNLCMHACSTPADSRTVHAPVGAVLLCKCVSNPPVGTHQLPPDLRIRAGGSLPSPTQEQRQKQQQPQQPQAVGDRGALGLGRLLCRDPGTSSAVPVAAHSSFCTAPTQRRILGRADHKACCAVGSSFAAAEAGWGSNPGGVPSRRQVLGAELREGSSRVPCRTV